MFRKYSKQRQQGKENYTLNRNIVQSKTARKHFYIKENISGIDFDIKKVASKLEFLDAKISKIREHISINVFEIIY